MGRRPQTTKASRIAFSTSRALDYLSEIELRKQCGFLAEDWPRVIVKELVDNALDACEEHGIAPEITVVVTHDYIEVKDNGPGIPADVVDRLLDFSVRVSSRAAYVGPTRGAQGNALKTLVGMSYVLNPGGGYVWITGGGVRTEIRLATDQVKQEPVADVDRQPGEGSVVRIGFGHRASSERFARYVDSFQDELWELALAFTLINPHLSLTFDVLDEVYDWEATDPQWSKWTPGPASAHWYGIADLEQLIRAYITYESERPNGRQRVVRDLLAEDFEGLSSTAKQRRILDQTELARKPLAELLVNGGREFDHYAIAELLACMKEETRIPKQTSKAAKDFGLIGEEHIFRRFLELDMITNSFEYKRIHTIENGVPQITEVAFAAVDAEVDRELITGVNWSPRIYNPFQWIGEVALDSYLADRRMDEDEPVLLLIHTATPQAIYTDPGKTRVQVREDDIEQAVELVGRKWTKQRKREERETDAAFRRLSKSMWASKGKRTLREACFEHLPAAWAHASNDGEYPASADQLFYAIRPLIDADPVEQKLDSSQRREYFKNTIWPAYLEEFEPDWDVVRGARGTYEEPHTGREISTSTLGIRSYLAHEVPDATLEAIDHSFPTYGAKNRIAGLLACEKEGFFELMRAAQIAARYDLALVSTKGMSAHAIRKLADELGVPVYVLHDFDKEGISIRSQFPNAIDIGLRIEDIKDIPTESRPILPKDPTPHKIATLKAATRANLRKNGASEEEIEFIVGEEKRVELNAMTSPEFIAFVERKLKKHKVGKVIPDTETLETAWTRAHLVKQVNAFIASELDKRENIPPMPKTLATKIKRILRDEPKLAWDDALWRLVGGE